MKKIKNLIIIGGKQNKEKYDICKLLEGQINGSYVLSVDNNKEYNYEEIIENILIKFKKYDNIICDHHFTKLLRDQKLVNKYIEISKNKGFSLTFCWVYSSNENDNEKPTVNNRINFINNGKESTINIKDNIKLLSQNFK